MKSLNKPNQEARSNVSVKSQTRQTNTIKKYLCKRAIFTTTLLLFLMAVSFKTASANEEARPFKSGVEFYKEATDFEIKQKDQKDFYIDYLLDESGKPYIISIKSKDKNMTHMVKKMFSENNVSPVQNNDGWYIITFLYEHIH